MTTPVKIDKALFKSTPWKHQLAVLKETIDAPEKALLMEQRTGKTKIIIDTAVQLHAAGRIRMLVVIAPNDVHRDWVELQLPAHCGVPVEAAFWRSSIVARRAFMAPRADGRTLLVRTINYEALLSDKVWLGLDTLLKKFDALLVLDESHRIKGPKNVVTKRVIALGASAAYRRILTGTVMGGAPIDLYSQYNFLNKKIMDAKTLTAFKARYAELVQPGEPLYEHIKRKTKYKVLQIIRRNEAGQQMWRNLDDLERRIAPVSIRIKRSDCKDTPPKMYSTLTYTPNADQRRWYNEVINTVDKELPRIARLNMYTAAQQVLSNIVPAAYIERTNLISSSNPRLERLLTFMESTTAATVVWCTFVEEITMIALALRERLELRVATLFGETPKDERAEIKRAFMAGELDVVVGHRRVGGTGQDFSRADNVVFYSNNPSLIERSQAEDRAQHMDKATSVGYYDIVARGTVDEIVLAAIRNKEDISEAVLRSVPGLLREPD